METPKQTEDWRKVQDLGEQVDAVFDPEAAFGNLAADRFKTVLDASTPEQLLAGLMRLGLPERALNQVTDLLIDAADANRAHDQAAKSELLNQPLTTAELVFAARATRDQLAKEAEAVDQLIEKEKGTEHQEYNMAQKNMLTYQIRGTERLEDAIKAAGEGATHDQILAELERYMEDDLNDKYPVVGHGTYGFRQDNYLGYHTTGAGFMEAGILLSAMRDNPAKYIELIAETQAGKAVTGRPIGSYESK